MINVINVMKCIGIGRIKFWHFFTFYSVITLRPAAKPPHGESRNTDSVRYARLSAIIAMIMASASDARSPISQTHCAKREHRATVCEASVRDELHVRIINGDRSSQVCSEDLEPFESINERRLSDVY